MVEKEPEADPEVSFVRIVAELPETKLIYGSVFKVLGTDGEQLKVKPVDDANPGGAQSVPAAWTKPTHPDFKQTKIVDLKHATRTEAATTPCWPWSQR